MTFQAVPAYTPPEDGMFYNALVPTVDTARNTFVLDLVARMSMGRVPCAKLLSQLTALGNPVLWVGDSGTSKTVTIQHYLRNLPSDSTQLIGLNFSSRTSSMDVQNVIEVGGSTFVCRFASITTKSSCLHAKTERNLCEFY